MILSYIVQPGDAGKPIKYILKTRMDLSENLIKKLKYNQKILCNSNPVFVNYIVQPADEITACIDLDEASDSVLPQPIPIEILYEDACLIAVNKAPDMVVHPTALHLSGTIANGLMYHMLQQGEQRKIRPVSRLDRDTSGILLFAKNPFVQEQLIRQMAQHIFVKEYIGITAGNITPSHGTIDLPIDRAPDSIMLRQISTSGSPAITHYTVLESLTDASLVKFVLETGRTHQIRVHCQAIGHPLLGDWLYNTEASSIIPRQALHSVRVKFKHPFTLEDLALEAPMPQDMLTALEILRK